MAVLKLEKKADKYYAEQFVKEYCSILESKKYPEEIVTKNAVNAIRQISGEDKEFAENVVKALKKKYKDTEFTL